MAVPTIDLAFIKQYEAEVKDAYQRQGSKLRGSVRTKNGIVGSSTTFQKAGAGTASTKSRHGTIPPMNVDHSTVECSLADFYAGDWIDKMDELKTNIDERGVVTRAGAYALGRKTDDLILAQFAAATSARLVPDGAGDLANSAALTRAKVFAALELLNNSDVPDDGMRYCVVTPGGWSDLLALTEFANTQYIGTSDLPYGGAPMEMKRWLGVTWMRHTALNGSDYKVSTLAQGFMWHPTSVGHAIAAEVSTDITWHGDRYAHWVVNTMSQGAKLIDETGVVKFKWTE